ncbi:TolC family protein [Mucilaginibacter arboris]|uniref:TolC family protein n=1 Tax=Mucilaginibacter arboris TaxID=2682090 RepID=A0A7K1SS91_9SPHI|nr:TolC family protein [Mucilaginibacter arboris]MVN20114.1 TolC family protein [Mucilaginibacter arboris]
MIEQINKLTSAFAFNSRRATVLKCVTSVLLLVAATVGTVNAQDRTLTLDEAIKLGLDNSKTLKYSQSKIDQAVSQYNQAKDRALPSGSVSYMYSRAQIPVNNLSFGTSSFSLPKSANANLGIASLAEPIYAGGKFKYARESTDLLVKVARLDVDNDKDQITYGIINEYYNLYKVLQNKKVVEQNLATVDQQIKQAQRFFEQGIVTKNDVLRFQLQRSDIELNGIELESNRKIINYNLNVLLGLPETTEIGVSQVNTIDDPVLPLTNYLDSAYANRPELRQVDLRTQIAETNIKNTRADRLPTLAATVGAYYLDIALNPFPTKGNYITPLTAGLSFSWNFGSLWSNKNRETEARIERDQTIINKGITTDNLKNEVNQNYQNYLAALNKVNLLQTSIAQATENNRLQESRYRSNIATATDRADAQTLLYQAQINLELAKADAGLAYYNLLKSTGKINK